MAENDTPQHDRTEQPSAKRLDDARARGEVPRSRELAMTAVVIAGAAALLGGGGYFAEGLAGLFELGLAVPRAALYDVDELPQALGGGMLAVYGGGYPLRATLLLVVLYYFAALAAEAAVLGRALWSMKF